MRTVEEVYGEGFGELDAFETTLDESLDPRGLNNLMFGIVGELGLPRGSAAVDVGAREGFHCIDEFRRVLRPGGRVLLFMMTATEWLTAAEAKRLWPVSAIHASSADPRNIDAAIAGSGLTVERCVDLHGEIREFLEETGVGRSSRQLLWISRLLRDRPTYEERFGTAAYEVMLTDCLWGVYQMIGKLNPRLYLLVRS